jgi:hypothetical protein
MYKVICYVNSELSILNKHWFGIDAQLLVAFVVSSEHLGHEIIIKIMFGILSEDKNVKTWTMCHDTYTQINMKNTLFYFFHTEVDVDMHDAMEIDACV